MGPGMRLFVLGVVGPVPNDDFLQVELNRTSDGEGFTYGTIMPPIAGTNLVTLGYDGRLKTIVAGAPGGMADGTAMSVHCTQYHANGTVVDSSATTSYGVLDCRSYVWSLLRYAGSNGSASLDEILSAVRTTFPAT